MSEADDPIMLSALQHWSYCPRQCALIHQVQAFDENMHAMRGKAVTQGAIYHHTSRRRRVVAFTEELRKQVEETIAAIRAMLASGKLPPPANDARCKECSLNEICQPRALAAKKEQHALAAALFEVDE